MRGYAELVFTGRHWLCSLGTTARSRHIRMGALRLCAYARRTRMRAATWSEAKSKRSLSVSWRRCWSPPCHVRAARSTEIRSRVSSWALSNGGWRDAASNLVQRLLRFLPAVGVSRDGANRADKLCARRLRSDEMAWIVVPWSSCYGAKENACLFVRPRYPSHWRIKGSFPFICCVGGVFDKTKLIDVFFGCTKTNLIIFRVSQCAFFGMWSINCLFVCFLFFFSTPFFFEAFLSFLFKAKSFFQSFV